MKKQIVIFALLVGLSVIASAASKPHVVSLGAPNTVKLFIGPSEDNTVEMKIRPLYVDGKIKEFTTGETHDVTDRLFTVRRAFRINDSLPEDERKLPKWMWQRGGWLLVDRTTGRVSTISLPEFDPFYSDAAWYRDYVAYCGISDNAEKVYAVVVQLGRKKPLLRKDLGQASNGSEPGSECARPDWDRKPARVTFQPKRAEKFIFTVPGHTIDAAPGSEEE